jgi:hypothetical protein
MKKTIVILATLIFAAACAAPPTNREVTPAANTNSARESAVALTEAEATAKEKAAWEAIKNKDYDAFAAILASDSMEVSPSNVYDKAGSVASVKEFEPTELDFSDWKFLQLDKDAFVVTYTVKVTGKYQGKDFPPESVRASSAWVNRDGKWLSVYHQECAIKSAPPPPPAKATPTPKTTASPAAAPAMAATGPDAIANEKMVWDMFKSKDYVGFAAVLADDFIEVEPNEVYDKAASVKSAQFDASKAVLSDWKVVKIDDAASLVTYLVKMPGMAGMSPDGERHSTIWTSRDGKWLARFHHGTPVVKAPAMTMMPSKTASPAPAGSPKMSASPK